MCIINLELSLSGNRDLNGPTKMSNLKWNVMYSNLKIGINFNLYVNPM